MHQELHQFIRNNVWELVPRPKDTHVITLSESSRTWLMRMVRLCKTNKISGSRIYSSWRCRLWWVICSGSKTWVHSDSSIHSMYHGFQDLPNGCEERIFEWASLRRSICWATKRVSRSLFFGPCSLIEESSIWVEISTKGMVWSSNVISFGSWLQKRLSRPNYLCQKRWEISSCRLSLCRWHYVWFINRCTCSRIFRRNEERIPKEHGGWAKLLSLSSTEATKR